MRAVVSAHQETRTNQPDSGTSHDARRIFRTLGSEIICYVALTYSRIVAQGGRDPRPSGQNPTLSSFRMTTAHPRIGSPPNCRLRSPTCEEVI